MIDMASQTLGATFSRGLLNDTDMPQIPTNSTGEDAEAAETFHALAVMTWMLLLGLALVVGQLLEKNSIDWMSEAGGALIIGIVLGLIVTLATNINPSYEGLFKFNTDFFFIFLLPPIIFDAGFNLEVGPFVKNTGAICMLAFVGTGISTFVIAILMWVLGLMRLSFRITLFHSMLFGAIISATDPVTVLAVFSKLKADKNLNALVFGESVMNDAVAIVLYQVISNFADNPFTFSRVVYGLWEFVYIFLGSLAIGVAVACVAALLFRTQYFRNDHAPVEAGLVIILAYSSFYITDGLNLSGIVSIMFCGMFMAKYVRPNLSRSTDDRVGAFFRVIASLAEIFVFIYIGCALFTEEQAWGRISTWAFIFWSLATLAVSRYMNVYPSTAFINLLRPPEQQIPETHKNMLWFSGLRGAMAFALATLANNQYDNDSSKVALTSTFFMVLITVLINGGAAPYMLHFWNLFDMEGSARSPPPPQTLAVLVSQTSDDLDTSNGQTYSSDRQNNKSTTGSTVIDSIHDFQRQGGLNRQFEHLDKVFSTYLVAPTEAVGVGESQSLAPVKTDEYAQVSEQ